MKKTILSLMLLLGAAMTMSAQSLLLGDTDQNGKLTIADITKSVNMILGKEAQGSIDLVGMAYRVDNTALVGTWELNETTVTFNEDGTTDYSGAATYKFLPVQGTIILYDADKNPVGLITVVDITSDGLLLMVGSSLLSCRKDTHEYVDLDLPSGTLWATCNVGADNPEDYGLYFAWGETMGYTSDTSDGYSFSWSTYKYCEGSNKTMTKYCNNSSYGYNGFTDTLTELLPEDDAAYVNWGKNWRMPTYDQQTELINSYYTTIELTTRNGVNGRLITSKSNGKSIFLPAAGYRYDVSLNGAGYGGNYWSRTFSAKIPSSAYFLYFDSGNVNTYNYGRNIGLSVRPVRVSQ